MYVILGAVCRHLGNATITQTAMVVRMRLIVVHQGHVSIIPYIEGLFGFFGRGLRGRLCI